MKIKKLVSISLICVLMVGLISGCGKKSSGGGGDVDGSGLKMIYSSYAWTGDTFKTMLMEGVSEAANSAGVTLDVQEECTSVDMQVKQIEAAAAGGYDAIICVPVDSTTALQLEVAAGDLPIVFLNTLPSDDHLISNKYVYVGSPERDAGRLQAEYVWDKLGKPKELNAIIFMGEQGHSATIGRTAAVKDFFKDNGVNANFVFCDYATWSGDIAQEKFDVFMKENKDFDAVFCNNDGMALGVIESYKKYNISFEDKPICGVDATADGCQAIVDGQMQFTAFQPAAGQSQFSVKTAVALAKNGSAEGIEGLDDEGKKVWVPFEPVNASNVKDYM